MALFNAIAKSKLEAEEVEAETTGGDKANDKQKKSLKEIAKSNFFEMLNQGTSSIAKPVVKDTEAASSKKWAVLEDAPYIPSNKSSFKVRSEMKD